MNDLDGARTPTPPRWADEALPGWFPARITPYGPGYIRYVTGKGMLQVGYEHRQYRWWLPAGPGRDGFATGRQAMRDADRLAEMLPPGMFAALDAGELLALYRELTQAHPRRGTDTSGTGEWEAKLASMRTEVPGQLEIAALDAAYTGPGPLRFALAAQMTSAGAVDQAMRASQDRHRELLEGAATGQAIRASCRPARPAGAAVIPGGAAAGPGGCEQRCRRERGTP